MMGQLKKAGFLIGFLLLMCFKGYSQDTAAAIKKIYKISPGNNGTLIKDTEPQVKPKSKAVYSCDVDPAGKKVSVSFEQADGTLTKETYELIEDKK